MFVLRASLLQTLVVLEAKHQMDTINSSRYTISTVSTALPHVVPKYLHRMCSIHRRTFISQTPADTW